MQTGRIADPFLVERGQRPAGDPLGDLAEDEAVVDHVVGRDLARGPARLRTFGRADRRAPTGHGQHVDDCAPRDRHARAVRQDVPDRDGGFAELGPVARDRLVEVDQPVGGEPVHEQRDERLTRGEDPEQTFRPAPVRLVQHDVTVADHAYLSASTAIAHESDDVVGADRFGALTNRHVRLRKRSQNPLRSHAKLTTSDREALHPVAAVADTTEDRYPYRITCFPAGLSRRQR